MGPTVQPATHIGSPRRHRLSIGPNTLLRRALSLLTAAGLIVAGSSLTAQEVQHLNQTFPGGMPGLPVVTGVEQLTNGVRVTWDGPSGYYQLFSKMQLSDAWHALGGRTNLARRETVTAIHSNAFFRVEGPAPKYAGSQVCLECHENTHHAVMDTRHTQAFETLRKYGEDKNASCLPCHTVGFALPTGFSDEFKTPHLRGVQCESCHGPGANHAANEMDPLYKPRVEIASQVCGGCHTGTLNPTFEEWNTSAHKGVVLDMNSSSRIDSCGRCHSGSARLSLLKGEPLPYGDANMGIECITCHNPHSSTRNPAQLHNPLASLQDYFITTGDPFLSQYNPEINNCAQCHNHRGASWTETTRPPHYSPQYNFLLGTVGELKDGLQGYQAAHASLQKQCVSCHMPSSRVPSRIQKAHTSHTFEVESFDSCRSCHPLPELLVEFASYAITTKSQEVKAALDLWATTKANETLRTRFGVRAWEYTSPGPLSSGGPGPTSREQAMIPTGIKKARFNLYLVVRDGSGGAHNGPHAIDLLDSAMAWVREELNK